MRFQVGLGTRTIVTSHMAFLNRPSLMATLPSPSIGFRSAQKGSVVSPASVGRQAARRKSRGQVVKISAVFERFTERAIKGVMLAQSEAKLSGCAEVNSL
jgi:hypothetical protein